MKIYKLTVFEIGKQSNSNITTNVILVEYYETKYCADRKKVETLAGLADLLGAGVHGKYEIDIQEIDVKITHKKG